MAFDPGNLLIVGAGFSMHAGLPLASGFTSELIDLKRINVTGPSARQVAYIQAFVDQVFGEGSRQLVDQWPELEDIFTLIDLSANSGHHLGTDFSAADLRVTRRAIIVRMIRMLSQVYDRKQKKPDDNWRVLESFFERFDARKTAVLCMNWDTVFERGIARTQDILRVDYGCHATPVTFDGSKLRPRKVSGETLTIQKPHGSVNWLYCDACRETFWVGPSETAKVAQTLFRRRDWEVVLKDTKLKRPLVLDPACPHCGAESLGTRFATFSYRKALDFPMHSASWRTAEQYLKGATDWVFIGYSMPAADFEFKHLLKRVQLTERQRPDITVITGGTRAEAKATIDRYKKFFGDVPKRRFFFTDGLDGAALAHLQSIKVLRP